PRQIESDPETGVVVVTRCLYHRFGTRTSEGTAAQEPYDRLQFASRRPEVQRRGDEMAQWVSRTRGTGLDQLGVYRCRHESSTAAVQAAKSDTLERSHYGCRPGVVGSESKLGDAVGPKSRHYRRGSAESQAP